MTGYDNLYPTQLVTDLEDEDFVVNAGQQMVFQLPVALYARVSVLQTPASQDYSLRCWFATEPGGSSIDFYRPMLSFWHSRTSRVFTHTLFTDVVPVGDVLDYSIKVEPGIYYLNVINLTNVKTRFKLLVSLD